MEQKQKQKHSLTIVDFTITEHQTIFVQFSCYDAVLNKVVKGEVKFIGGVPYGDILHPDRSILSMECREVVKEQLVTKYQSGEIS
ncbi:hypothetical protein [Bacillus suaedae]|uniref:Uncharacterized protein n=1 Tax=Halalkalibacter suaedae TaxID=2822140 RepID=A0A940WZE9_9BACI|nr:hypothetical protein [Bacillus suaedae]MBP3951600.1 hypothetical protein [Bacillus suaedae]